MMAMIKVGRAASGVDCDVERLATVKIKMEDVAMARLVSSNKTQAFDQK